jgi:hypothetical protein
MRGHCFGLSPCRRPQKTRSNQNGLTHAKMNFAMAQFSKRQEIPINLSQPNKI